MSSTETASNTTAPTQFITVGDVQYAYRQFGSGAGIPLVCLQHFTGTLDNWDPAVTDRLAERRSVILFENAGVGRSTGKTPDTVAGMAAHALAFVDALGLTKIDLLGFSLGGMLAQEMASDRPTLVRRIILAGTGPEGGEDMGMDKPRLMQIFTDQKIPGPEKLVKLFFVPSETSQSAGWAFLQRLGQRTEDREPVCSMETRQAQAAAIGAWGQSRGERFARLRQIKQPALVFNGNDDIMIPTRNSFLLSQYLPNALLIIYPDSGHGALFQYAVSFTRHATEFLDSEADIPGI